MITYLIAALLLLASLYLFIRLARHYQIVDKPNHRSSHDYEPVRGGGIVFVMAGILWAGYSFFGESGSLTLPYLLTGFLALALISFLDDLYTLPSGLRMIVHLGAVVLAGIQLGAELPWWLWAIGGICLIGWINAFNFMDGINGITSCYAGVTLLSLGWVNHQVVTFAPMEFLGFMLLALVIFSWFNFRKRAICFAGDVGAISLALLLGYLVIKLMLVTGEISYLLFLLIYAVDAVGTITERLIKREKIFEPHRLHLYQLLANEKRIDHRVVSLGYAFLQLAINAIILWSITTQQNSWLFAIGLFLAVSLIYAYIKIVRFKVFESK
ncbi:UDP-N-acetylmuramyl pentapeptide phosphotransferase/UDP-N-acetylglucosamine-1-phosphate transferase [Marinoscillum furvescens DSM 4134]|uniref:UDP-N-acetylmuramyl pentapeptide phosphotransferase/UDP-N-acetylglucosamine-1-phosphate transferase n=1 Tax=Marinoscillum furvescens DSM 4134 TaxID=1122208 RepID=A0A3D9L0T8_MARFU|nr:UDP-N-acetylmuramyl pentapeptide phosphotransferase/UDP-N-acetylglucosamine-1-phosphate transferase [Marinoscillum furvescens DSM 4134]